METFIVEFRTESGEVIERIRVRRERWENFEDFMRKQDLTPEEWAQGALWSVLKESEALA